MAVAAQASNLGEDRNGKDRKWSKMVPRIKLSIQTAERINQSTNQPTNQPTTLDTKCLDCL
jgi:hypothetical protein